MIEVKSKGADINNFLDEVIEALKPFREFLDKHPDFFVEMTMRKRNLAAEKNMPYLLNIDLTVLDNNETQKSIKK